MMISYLVANTSLTGHGILFQLKRINEEVTLVSVDEEILEIRFSLCLPWRRWFFVFDC